MEVVRQIRMLVPRRHPHARDVAFDLEQERAEEAVEARRVAQLPGHPARVIWRFVQDERWLIQMLPPRRRPVPRYGRPDAGPLPSPGWLIITERARLPSSSPRRSPWPG